MKLAKFTEVEGYGARYDSVVDLAAYRSRHRPYQAERGYREWDGNMAAAYALLQSWRSAIFAGFPITPSTKWLETIAAEMGSGRFPAKKLKLLEAEHAVADYLVGAAASCRDLLFSTATSSVGLDHMTETVRSLGASGLGNVMLVNVYRATANFPICIEGDPSDTLAHRDSGFIQVCCRGVQQIYDTIVQLPAVGMDPEISIPTMPGYYGIKDSHRTMRLQVEPDETINAFHDRWIPACPYPSLINGDTAMGNIVTSQYFQGFKFDQKARMEKVIGRIQAIASDFQTTFGRTGIELFETHGFESLPQVAIVGMGPDMGTLIDLLPRLVRETGVRIGVVVCRLLSPFPSAEMAALLSNVDAIAVVNNAHHHGRGHLTLDVADALQRARFSNPIDSFFTGLGGANVSDETWRRIVQIVRQTAKQGKSEKPYHLVHEGVQLG
jgi:pyruvate ferredoxin oxidoreductase alpha subunit